MASKIEDYGMIGNTLTAALVSRSGSIDWLCAPRFDSDACFAALIGYDEHGRWGIEPTVQIREKRQRYRNDTLVLETEFVCDGGAVRLVDFMPMEGRCDVVRIVEGLDGEVPLEMLLDVRFGYGADAPLIERTADGTCFMAGPDALVLRVCRAPPVRGQARIGLPEREEGRSHPVAAHLVPLAREPALGSRRRPGAGVDRVVLAHLGGPLHVRGALARCRAALADHAQGDDLRADRRHRGRADQLAARVASAACATGTTASAGCATPA